MSTIYLIRHAEKPSNVADDDTIMATPVSTAAPPVTGVDANGNADPYSLTPHGWARAGTWATYFNSSGPVTRPDRIYASASEKLKLGVGMKEGSHSKRPVETVQALADKLGYQINTSFFKGGEDALVANLKTQAGVTLVAWQHERIPYIASSLLMKPALAAATWPGDRFDVIFVFTSNAGGGWDFSQICPQLLGGDPATPIDLP